MRRADGRRKSDFIESQVIDSGAFFDFFKPGENRKISYQNLMEQLGVTGTITQTGNPTGVAVLDEQGTDYRIRAIETGSGVKASVSALNGVKVEHNFVSASPGYAIFTDTTATQPKFRTLLAGDGVEIAQTANSLTIGQVNYDVSHALASMQDNATATVIADTAIPVRVNGTFVAGVSSGFTVSAAGRATYTGTLTKVFKIDAILTADPATGATQEISAYVAVNGTVEAGSRIQTEVSAGEPGELVLVWAVDLEPSDYVEIFIQNESSVTNVTVIRAVLRIT